jgi:chemotaxis protein CheY-P-specific phosphatase CheC
MRNTLGERELDKFVESPTRSGKSAVEVVGQISIDTTGLATSDKQDEQTAELQSINSELQTLNATDFSTLTAQQAQSTILNSIDSKLSSQATSAKQDLLLAELQLKADLTEVQPVSVSSLPLPTNAATSALQTAGNNILSNILTAIGSVLNIRALAFLTDKVDASGSSVSVSNFPASQNVVVTSSALPSGASTSALQTSGNSILSNILTAIQGVLNIRSLVFATDKVDVSGSSINATIINATKKNTYGASSVNFVAASAATDIFTIVGAAGKKIKIIHISVSATQTNRSRENILLVKRSTLNTGGTSTVLTNVPFDSTQSAATATVRSYTANPTLGTSIGTIQAEKITIGSLNGNNSMSEQDLVFEFGENDSKEIILNNQNESLSVNLNGVTLLNNQFTIDAKWIEE